MDQTTEYIIFAVAILLILSIALSKAVSRLALPALLVFLAIGMLAGSEGLGGIYFDNPSVAQFIGVLALSLIIFAGGFHTKWDSIRPVMWTGIALSTVGVLITALVVGTLSSYLFEMPFKYCLLLGAIVCSTDAAAVFSVLRSRKVNLKGSLAPLLEFESASNDPMAVLLTIGFIQVIMGADASSWMFVLFFIKQLVFGAVAGYLIGRIAIWLMHHFKLEYEGLYPPLLISLVLFAYSATALIGGSGFLAVYIAGIMMARSEFPRKKSLMEFHDGLAWMMQIMMFVILGLLVFPSELVKVAVPGLIISAVLMFVARPVSVFLPLVFSKSTSLRERTLISWVGLRGSVPIVLATFPLLAGVPYADVIFNVVFFIVLTSVLVQATSISFIARRLKLDAS